MFGFFLPPLPAGAGTAADCGAPADLHDGWETAAPQQVGLDSALICGIGPRLEALEEAKAHGVVLARHGALVYEHLFCRARLASQHAARRSGLQRADKARHPFDQQKRDLAARWHRVRPGIAYRSRHAGLLILPRIRRSANARKRSHYAASSSYDVVRACVG